MQGSTVMRKKEKSHNHWQLLLLLFSIMVSTVRCPGNLSNGNKSGTNAEPDADDGGTQNMDWLWSFGSKDSTIKDHATTPIDSRLFNEQGYPLVDQSQPTNDLRHDVKKNDKSCIPKCVGKVCGSDNGCEGICQIGSGCTRQKCPNGNECTVGVCSYGLCCNTGECGWGALNLCAPNGSQLESNDAKATCRNGIWKTAYAGWGCEIYECDIGRCTYNICCNATECAWGEPFDSQCVTDGGQKENQWLIGICRSGSWKTVHGGWGCDTFPCDKGTCISNQCF